MSSRSQASRYAWVLSAIIAPSLLLAQSVFTYRDTKGDLSLKSRDGQGEMISNGYKFILRGAVSVTSKSRAFTLTADRVEATVSATKSGESPNDLRIAKATGKVKLVQSSAGQNSTLTANSVTYQPLGNQGKVEASGSVTIQNIDSAKRESMRATGSSGSATLDKTAQRGVRTAELKGPVRVDVVQSSKSNSKVVFTGGRLTLTGDTITLSGNVKASGSGASQFGNLSNVDSLTVYLNDKGEMSRFTFKSGGLD